MAIASEPKERSVDVLDVAGNLDASDMVRMKGQLDDLISKEHTQIVLYFKDAKQADFIGLGMLVERLRRMRSLNGDLKLVGLNAYILKLLRMTGVNKLIETYDNTTDAINSFSK